MSRVEQITEQLRSLTGPELKELRAWLDEHEQQLWDEQFEADVAAGRWEKLADQALAEHADNKTSRL